MIDNQEPVAWAHYDTFKNLDSLTRARFKATLATKKTGACCIPLYIHPPQRTEQNFCSRCGKRTADLTTIHTCTPPQENT